MSLDSEFMIKWGTRIERDFNLVMIMARSEVPEKRKEYEIRNILVRLVEDVEEKTTEYISNNTKERFNR